MQRNGGQERVEWLLWLFVLLRPDSFQEGLALLWFWETVEGCHQAGFHFGRLEHALEFGELQGRASLRRPVHDFISYVHELADPCGVSAEGPLGVRV
jgi:hypothetical protein